MNRIPHQVHHEQHKQQMNNNNTKQGITTNNLFSTRFGLPTQNLDLVWSELGSKRPNSNTEVIQWTF
jgi:hypothetical protein